MNYFLLFLSVSVNAAYSSFHNYLGKRKIRCAHDNYTVNSVIYGVGALAMLVLLAFLWQGASAFTVIFGIFFGAVTAFSGVFELKALSSGPMSFTILIITSSMILPAFSGAVIWNEELSVLKIIGTLIMITATYFTAVKDGGETSLKWLGYCLLTFLCSGSIGIMQKVQQNSAYAAETTPFLTSAFLSATLVCLVFAGITLKKAPSVHDDEDGTKESTENGKSVKIPVWVIFSAVCGLFIAFLNVVNLYLSGVLPSAVMFPVQNGGTTVLSVLSAIVIFREKLSKRKVIGLLLGMVALTLLII